jgi:hypothetical protein
MAKHNFPFNMYDICELEGYYIPHDGRANHTVNCPVCGKLSLIIGLQEDNFICFNASCEISGGMLQFYAYCEGKEGMSLSDGRKEIMERLYGYKPGLSLDEKRKINKAADERRRKLAQQQVHQCDRRSIDDCDKTYSALLDMLSLSDDHYDNLINRGLTKETIISRKYRTFPIVSHEEYPLKLMEGGYYIDGVPGFFKNNNMKWELRTIKRGIMIPISNRNNKIVGFQVRKDDNLLKTFYKRNATGAYELDANKMKIPEKEKKFTWLSSKGLQDGTGVNGSIHYSCDFVLENNVFVPKVPENKGIVLSEGPLKGDIFHEKTNYPAITVPGVNCYEHLAKELDFLRERGFKTIYNGYDMDYDQNPNVYKSLEKSYDLILSKGFELKRLLWNNKYKGIDDYYEAKSRGVF